MRTITVRNVVATVKSVRPKPSLRQKKTVESIILAVQKNGDRALKEYEKKFDGVKLGSLRVSKSEIKKAYSKVTKEQIQAIKIIKRRLEKTELALKDKLQNVSIQIDGTKIKKIFLPIESVGCYIPGGKAKYPSSVVMSVVPARVAGVRKVIAVSPPNKKGQINPLTLVAADICGVDEFYKIGGAQAIAALAYGTKSIPRVDKIVGPGGSFVSIAKTLVSEFTSIDMVAGPTELAVIADSTAEPDIVVSDLISQAEHSSDTLCCVITTSAKLKDGILELLNQKIPKIKRSNIVRRSLQKNGFIALCKKESDVIEFVNRLAPEHLEIITKRPQKIAQKITTAGLVLIGKNSPSAASDYLLGSNHILPTNGFGRTRGSLSVLDFMKIHTQLESSKASLQKIRKYMRTLAMAEDLPNHFEAIRSRIGR